MKCWKAKAGSKSSTARSKIYHLFPEYYLIRINNFNDIAATPLDEWIYLFNPPLSVSSVNGSWCQTYTIDIVRYGVRLPC